MALALAAVSTARQNEHSASGLPQALQDFEQTLQPSSANSDSAEALAGERTKDITQQEWCSFWRCPVLS